MKRKKFRVRNNKAKQWIYGPGDEVDLFGETILLGYFMPVSIEDLNDCVALEYIGLKDKYEKEIYEGDIVQTATESEFSADRIWSVNYEEVVWIEQEARFGLKEHRQWGNDRGHFPFNPYEIKIIGNIFDNPELLKL